MDLELKNKRVLITASTQGIGRAAAESFLKEGAKVVINGRDKKKLDDAIKELHKEFPEAEIFGVCGSALQLECLSQLKKEVIDRLHGLDIIVSNLGSGKPELQDKLAIEEWKRLLEINLFSAVELLHEFMPLLRMGNSPSIVLMSSITAKEVMGTSYAYAAAKNAIVTLTNYLSKDAAESNIRVNCVLPGNVLFAGGRWEELLQTDKEGVMQMINREVSLKRFARPEEIADAIVFLSSQKASFITGTVLTVDGGQTRSI